jgi:hypothetical protein
MLPRFVCRDGGGPDSNVSPAEWRPSPFSFQLDSRLDSSYLIKAERMVFAQDVEAQPLFTRGHHAAALLDSLR